MSGMKPLTPNLTLMPAIDDASVFLTPPDREALSYLAAVQIRYNRPAEAVPYLMALRKTDMSDHRAARLLALALAKLGHWEQAEIILEDIRGVSKARKPTVFVKLCRGLVKLIERKVAIVRKLFQ